LFSENEHRVGVIIGTGPSLTVEQVLLAKNYKTFGVNLTFRYGVDVLLACNSQFWDHYWNDIKWFDCHKWTPRLETASKYAINYIEEKWEPGLNKDPNFINAHHGSGPQILNLAYHYGVKTLLLIGWDMKFPGKVNDKEYTKPRHFFGEYPKPLQHWPKTDPDGSLRGLIKEVETIKPEDYGIKIINCTPDSALKCFPYQSLSEFHSNLNALKV